MDLELNLEGHLLQYLPILNVEALDMSRKTPLTSSPSSKG